MAEIVNLRRVRKQKLRANAAAEAAARRASFGRTKAEKRRDEKTAESLARAVDRAKLDKE